jgi:hypothetical protein
MLSPAGVRFKSALAIANLQRSTKLREVIDTTLGACRNEVQSANAGFIRG